jgi:hypothetical protein
MFWKWVLRKEKVVIFSPGAYPNTCPPPPYPSVSVTKKPNCDKFFDSRTYAFIWIRMLDVNEAKNENGDGRSAFPESDRKTQSEGS